MNQDGAPQADVSWFINQACALDHISINALLGALARAAQGRQALQISTDASKEAWMPGWLAVGLHVGINQPYGYTYMYMVSIWFRYGLYVVYIWFIYGLYMVYSTHF